VNEVRKIGAVIPVSRQTLLDHGLVEPTEAERLKMEAWRAEYDQRRAAATAAWPTFVTQVAAIADPLARAVLNLHRSSDYGQCLGCEFGGYEAEPPSWPCETTATVAAAAGIEVPPDLTLAAQYRDVV
jgi:hypothetical protein